MIPPNLKPAGAEFNDDESLPTLILMRHAARDFTDDRLSPDGFTQAARLTSVLRNMNLPSPTRLHCSPKKRTQATLQSLSREGGQKITIDPRLDEQKQGEPLPVFEDRVKDFNDACLTWAGETARDTTDHTWLACSHLDWLEAAVLYLASDENDFERSEPWPPMAIRAYVFHEGIWKRKKAT